jgi:hypothetical protein
LAFGHFVFSELMHVLGVRSITLLAKTEVVALAAIEPKVTFFNGLEALIAYEPLVKPILLQLLLHLTLQLLLNLLIEIAVNTGLVVFILQ